MASTSLSMGSTDSADRWISLLTIVIIINVLYVFFYVIDLSKCLQVFQNTSAATGRRYLRYCWVDKDTRSTWSISSSIDGKRNQIHLGARGVCPAAGQLHSNPDIKITCSTHQVQRNYI